VFQDDYRYIEDRFGLAATVFAVVNSDRTPGVRRIRKLRHKVAKLGLVCLIEKSHFDLRISSPR